MWRTLQGASSQTRAPILIAAFTFGALLSLPGAWLGSYDTGSFMPHRHCWLREPGVTWLHVISDTLIGLAYVAIASMLVYVVYRARRDIPFHWMFAAFGLFIVACGFTHFMGVAVVWYPAYWLQGDVKAITAVASVATAFLLPPVIPRVFELIHAAKVSEQRKADLEVAHERLKESEQLRSQLFANVSHELRTPLSLILGPVRRRLSGDLEPTEREQMELIERNAGLLQMQVDNLLDIARLEAARLQIEYGRTDLAELVRVTASNFEVLAHERGIDFEVTAPERMQADVDVDKLQRLVLNLLSNAFKFTPEGGQIRVALRAADAGGATLTIEDSGPGIPEEQRAQVFERFRQIDSGATRRAGGAGLGLPIAKQLVELHGGRIDVETASIGGAAFRVELPLSAPEGAEVAEAPADLLTKAERGPQAVDSVRIHTPPAEEEGASADPIPELHTDQPLVLVVEDNPDMNRFIAQALQPEYRVASAYDGREGVEQTQQLRPDLIVCDIMMPHMSGTQMVETIRQDAQAEDVPVIVLTAAADEQQRVELLEGGADDYLVKPFQADELRARVRSFLERREQGLRQIHESWALMQAVIEGADDPIFVKDAQGRYRMVNRATSQFTGIAPAALEGHSDRELFSADAADRIEAADRDVLAHGSNATFEETVQRADGEIRTLLTTKGVYRSADGAPRGVFGLSRDITDRRRAEQALEELNVSLEARVAERTEQVEQQADQLRRMAADLTATEQRERRRLAQALHDGLQQMLVAAQMHLQQGWEGLDSEDANARSIELAANILAQSLEASRSLTLELYPPILYSRGLNAALHWLAEHFHEHHGLSVATQFEEQAEPQDPELQTLLFTAARELLLNVVKHAGASEATLSLVHDGATSVLTVEDDGVGCEFEDALAAADPRSGGLGLFSLRERLQVIGGSLQIAPRSGGGCDVTLRCPQEPPEGSGSASGPASSAEHTADSTSEGTGPQIRVLLADDHAIVREGLSGVLSSAPDLEIVAQAGDGREAIDALAEAEPHVVVMDVSMPGMDGIEATRRLQEWWPHIRVIGLSMHNEQHLADAMLDAGAVTYLTKGGPSSELIGAIRQAGSPQARES